MPGSFTRQTASAETTEAVNRNSKENVPILGDEVCVMRASAIAFMFVLAVVMALSSNVTAQAVQLTNGSVIVSATARI